MLPREITFTVTTAAADIVACYETKGSRMLTVRTTDCNNTEIAPLVFNICFPWHY